MRVCLSSVALLLLVLGTSEAGALPQSKHRSLTLDACWKLKLPDAFCETAAAAAYNVDHYEWSDLSAHAQPDTGESKCTAANKAVARVGTLASELRGLAKQTEYDPALAVALGRVLHTLQDNCAHHGIPNPAHAWLSLSDTCEGTDSSPDVQPEALSCAKAETAAALELFASQAQVPTPPPNPDGPGAPQQQDPMFFPPRGDVCAFLKSAGSWDGVDRRWNGALMVSALRSQYQASLLGDAPLADVCQAGESALEPSAPGPITNVSQPIEWCGALELYCLGKGDGANDAPPWEASTEPAASESSSGGCGVDPVARSGGWGIAALGLGLWLARRRRAR